MDTAQAAAAEKLPQETIDISVEFTGGLELLFGNVRKHKLAMPTSDSEGQRSNVNFLIQHLCDKYMKDPRRDMFLMNGTVRPGILVLINDADWELEGEGSYEIQNGDDILFVSTLHGG
ncbi:Ubiquitin- modifier 1 [Thelotrema lepadinum]|nr:Ubiquitin- modifier 1 [Thelotrema lepadinum]